MQKNRVKINELENALVYLDVTHDPDAESKKVAAPALAAALQALGFERLGLVEARTNHPAMTEKLTPFEKLIAQM